MMNCEIYVITHKECFYKTPEGYIPIQVGKCNTKFELPYIDDTEGNSISEKNANYCELTAWYWIWKNRKLPEYIGLCHYRRFFVKKSSFIRGVELLTPKDINKIMEGYDIILPRKLECGMSVKEFYYKHGEGREKDINEIENIIYELYPDYSAAMEKVFSSNKCSYWNLAIMKANDFKKYCKWLFDILFALESRIDLSDYTKAEARIYGYLSEILINVYAEKQNLRIYHCGMIFVDKNFVKNYLRKIREGKAINEQLS